MRKSAVADSVILPSPQAYGEAYTVPAAFIAVINLPINIGISKQLI